MTSAALPHVRPIRVLQVCDHLGWEGSRMHGVKRLFAWMIPRFDRARFDVSLVSLRKKDLSEETLDALGIDITYLQRGKFDPRTLADLLRIIDRRQIDVLHLHGYGATTFGRLAAAIRGLPVVLHEHANLTSTPWFQKVADRILEPFTDVAIAVSESTAEFVRDARLVRPERVKVVYLGAPLDEFGRVRTAEEVAAARTEIGYGPDDFLVGRSVHSEAEAIAAEAAGGCDYLTFGTVYESRSKPAGHPVAGVDALARVCSAVRLPVLAIGGITIERIPEVVAAGAAGVAAIGLFGHGTEAELAAIVARLRSAFDQS